MNIADFRQEIETLMDTPVKWELIYHASGNRDITTIASFQREVIEWMATIKSSPSPISYDEESISYGMKAPDVLPQIRIHTLQQSVRTPIVPLGALNSTC